MRLKKMEATDVNISNAGRPIIPFLKAGLSHISDDGTKILIPFLGDRTFAEFVSAYGGTHRAPLGGLHR